MSSKNQFDINECSSVEKAVLDSLCYRAVFNYPLSFYQISHFLLRSELNEGQVVSSMDLENGLKNLVRKGVLSYKNKRYHIEGRENIDWYDVYECSKRLIGKARDVSKYIEKIPWVKFVGITGTVSAFGAKSNDDIDVLIVSQRNRLWLTRAFVFFVLFILGELRRENSFEKKICPNIFLSEDNLAWDEDRRDLYVAYETVMMYPVYDRDNIYLRFMSDNDWVFDYFANLGFEHKLVYEKRNECYIMNFIERISFFLQKIYMKRKRTTEDISKNKIHFKKQDHKGEIMNKYTAIKDSFFNKNS